MGKAPCSCARAALVLDGKMLQKRTECMRHLDAACEAATSDEDVAALMARGAAAAQAEKEAVMRAEDGRR